LLEKKTDLQWVVTWIEANFNQTLGFATVSRHVYKLQLLFRLTNGCPILKNITEESYIQQYYECVLKLHNGGFFKWDPKKIVCIDCCTNSRRLEREKTISLKEVKPKKFSAAKAVCNTYVVAVCLEDKGQYPALMFTHDPAFDPLTFNDHNWAQRSYEVNSFIRAPGYLKEHLERNISIVRKRDIENTRHCCACCWTFRINCNRNWG
jgi:hypothetical protein